MAEGEWYYCLTHHVAEPFEGCKSADRLGPYPTRAEAERALEKVAERNEAWENDPRYNDDAEAPRGFRDDDEDDLNPFTP